MRIPEQKTVAIVSFNNQSGRQIYYQVTIDPDKVHGDFIRFGQPGDEITGWQKVVSLELELELAKWEEGGWNPQPQEAT